MVRVKKRLLAVYPAMIERAPSATNWTASAASKTPRSRVRTIRPVLPRYLSKNSAAIKDSRANRLTDAITPTMTACACHAWPALVDNRMLAEIAPGPAIRGMAKGKTAISAGLNTTSRR